MKKILLALVITFFMISPVYAQRVYIGDLTADADPTSDDLIETENDPSGIPSSRKVTLGNLSKGLTGSPTFTGVTTGTLSTTGETAIGDGGDLINLYLDSTPATDDTWAGAKMGGTAGAALAQWDLVYAKNAAGTLKWYPYNADTAAGDKLLAPRGIAVTAAAGDGTAFVIGIGDGIAYNVGWAMTTNQDEGVDVFASDATAGAITLTAPNDSGDQVARVGYVLEENVIMFSLGNVTLSQLP